MTDNASIPSTTDSRRIIEHFCCREDLATYDPYDIWKTSLGFRVKDLFNRSRNTALLPAAALTLFDAFLNNGARIFYTKQEYPIVRALAALSLLNLYRSHGELIHLEFAGKHLQWLVDHRCTGYSGACWGVGFRYAVARDLIYDEDTPFSTITPYALEAFVEYASITGDSCHKAIFTSIFDFFDKDIRVLKETEDWMATSYGPRSDRIVTNAISYTMYSYALLLPYLAGKARERTLLRIGKLYAFVKLNQRPDGSWLYAPEEPSFIDCFHTCIVLKNLFKTNSIMALPGSSDVIARGYAYLKEHMADSKTGLFRRFSLKNKPSLVKYDLYDNAEALNLAGLLGDKQLVSSLPAAIDHRFCQEYNVYSQNDVFGIRRNKNMLRWAVMPYLYAVSGVVRKHVV